MKKCFYRCELALDGLGQIMPVQAGGVLFKRSGINARDLGCLIAAKLLAELTEVNPVSLERFFV